MPSSYAVILYRVTLRNAKLSKNNLLKHMKVFKKGLHQNHKIQWIEPKGYETGVSVFNSFSKTKVSLKTLQPSILTWYNCGPTVYDSSHLGHAKCYVQLDIIRRILQDIFKVTVVQVTGITDIDDKIIKKAIELETSTQTVTQKYEEEFFRDMKMLNVLPPSLSPRVTDNISPILSFIQKIMENNLAYRVGEGTVYFDTSSYSRYGKLAFQDESNLIHSGQDPRKRSPRDFVLWKGSKPGEPFWDSHWGPGRPGWHIECSAMASKIFGDRLDLHSGGFDLLFPHHENEEAQCCAHHNYDQWCNYWIHTGHLGMNGSTKMSKSLGNTIRIEDFLKDHSANAFRMLCLFSHYKSSLEYTNDLIVKREGNLRKFSSFFEASQAYLHGQIICRSLDDSAILTKFVEVKENVKEYLGDDFNTSSAMQAVLELITLCNKELTKKSKIKVVGVTRSLGTIAAVRGYIYHLLSTLGLKFDDDISASTSGFDSQKQLSQVMDSVVNFRQEVKNFALLKGKQDTKNNVREDLKDLGIGRLPLLKACDNLRTKLSQAGIQIKDHSGATSWRFQEKKSSSGHDDSSDDGRN